MKFSKLAIMALVATGTVFAFTGCGDKKDDSAKSEKKDAKVEQKADDAAKKIVDAYIAAVDKEDVDAANKYTNEDMEVDEVIIEDVKAVANSFKYEKTVKVTDKYSVVCGTATLPKKGNVKYAYHVKDGKIVEVEDNWDPKDKHK